MGVAGVIAGTVTPDVLPGVAAAFDAAAAAVDRVAPVPGGGRFAGLLSLAAEAVAGVPAAGRGDVATAGCVAGFAASEGVLVLPPLAEKDVGETVAVASPVSRLPAVLRIAPGVPGEAAVSRAVLTSEREDGEAGSPPGDVLARDDDTIAAVAVPAGMAVVLPVTAFAVAPEVPQPESTAADERVPAMIGVNPDAKLAQAGISARRDPPALAVKDLTAARAAMTEAIDASDMVQPVRGNALMPPAGPDQRAGALATSPAIADAAGAPAFEALALLEASQAGSRAPAAARASGRGDGAAGEAGTAGALPLAAAAPVALRAEPAGAPPLRLSASAAPPRGRLPRFAASAPGDSPATSSALRVAGQIVADGAGPVTGGKPAAPTLTATAPRISVASERLGPVDVAVDGGGDTVRVTLGLGAAAAVQVSADVPRLSAELAAQGHRLQSLQFDLGGGGQGGRHDRSPAAPAPPRMILAADGAPPSAATADRYA